MSTPAPGPIGARLALPRRATFWCLAGVLCLFMFAAAAPSPLYTVYQAQWRFSATTLTAVFAIYALTLLSALLVLGSLSDHLGRRPVIVAALALNAGATALFLAAHGVALLFAARALQGVATGMATSALSASLIELQPAGVPQLAPMVNSAAPAVGLGAGALATSALVQYGPAPTHFVYWLLLAGFLAGIVGVLATPEPGTHRPGALSSLRPRAGMPQEARATFAAVLPSLLALWALAGLYLSLGPSLAAQLVGSHNLLWGGLVIFLLQGFAATASMLLRATEPQTAMLAGSVTLLAGLAVTLAGIAAGSAALFLPGTSIAGCGFGLAFLGVFRTLSALAPPEERAAMIATIYIASYLAFGIPVVIAGVAATHAGLHDTSIAYGLMLAALVGAAVVGMTVRRRRARLPAPQSTQLRAHHVPPCPGTLPHHEPRHSPG
jgi:Major Facilitator Superfamily